MELFTKDFGKMIFNMVKGRRIGEMVHHIMALITMERNKELDFINGMMGHNMEENGMKIKYME